MAKVINKVGALLTLKSELAKRNISQFNSVKDIRDFESTYERQIDAVETETRFKHKTRLESLSNELSGLDSLIESKRSIVEKGSTK